MKKKDLSIAIGVAVILVIILAVWGHHELTPHSGDRLTHGSVTLPATGVPPIWVRHGSTAAGALPPGATPAAMPGGPAQFKQYEAQHPGQAAQILKEKQSGL